MWDVLNLYLKRCRHEISFRVNLMGGRKRLQFECKWAENSKILILKFFVKLLMVRKFHHDSISTSYVCSPMNHVAHHSAPFLRPSIVISPRHLEQFFLCHIQTFQYGIDHHIIHLQDAINIFINKIHQMSFAAFVQINVA